MRIAVVAASLAVVLAASALNLALGAAWVASVVVIALLRRRFRPVAWVVLILALGVGAASLRLGWAGRPPERSYGSDEVGWLQQRLGLAGGTVGAEPSRGDAIRARLAARRSEELGEPVAELERRALTLFTAGRGLTRFRDRAPGEVEAAEQELRRLALTLTSPEFRDLDGRVVRLREWLDDLEARLDRARSAVDLDEVARALESPALATVSLRALREDVRRVGAAAAAVVRAAAGGGVSVRLESSVAYREERGELSREDRYLLVADGQLGIARVDVGALRRGAAAPGFSQTVLVGIDEGEPRPLTGTTEATVTPAARRVVVLDRRVLPAEVAAVRSGLRPVAFQRVTARWAPARSAELLVIVTAASVPATLAVAAPASRLVGVALPRYALHRASPGLRLDAPGAARPAGTEDRWVPVAEPGAETPVLEVELSPPIWLLRTAAFSTLKAYLYTPNLTAGLAVTALGALTVVAAGRRPRKAVVVAPARR